MTTNEPLLCGLQLISPSKGKSTIVRKNGDVVFSGTYKQCKAWAKNNGYLLSQSPSAR